MLTFVLCFMLAVSNGAMVHLKVAILPSNCWAWTWNYIHDLSPFNILKTCGITCSWISQSKLSSLDFLSHIMHSFSILTEVWWWCGILKGCECGEGVQAQPKPPGSPLLYAWGGSLLHTAFSFSHYAGFWGSAQLFKCSSVFAYFAHTFLSFLTQSAICQYILFILSDWQYELVSRRKRGGGEER